MTYHETIEYLYNAAPAFTKVGAAAYKEGLENTLALDRHSGYPHHSYLTVHVAGTNGKGSCSHSLAAILQNCGLKTGLFTSPHLVTFRERIRVNGEMIPEEYVVKWVERNRHFFENLSPSFFELSTAMALEYFRDEGVDIAVIEVGLGGRLDCTNIITPILSVITNISFDHTQFLGNSLESIAHEKAGIIKEGVPVVVGETVEETRRVFCNVAKERNAEIILAEENAVVLDVDYQLRGEYQKKNLNTVLNCLLPLGRELKRRGYNIHNATANVRQALEHVCDITGLQGRWQTLASAPLTICDTGHNVAGWRYLAPQIIRTWQERKKENRNAMLKIVFGMVDDKDIDTVLAMLPKDAQYFFTQAETHRAIPAEKVREKAEIYFLKGISFKNVTEAYKAAQQDAKPEDMIFVGGSSYIVADLLAAVQKG